MRNRTGFSMYRIKATNHKGHVYKFYIKNLSLLMKKKNHEFKGEVVNIPNS